MNIEFSKNKTYFGLSYFKCDNGSPDKADLMIGVQLFHIEKLPFYDFWYASDFGSSMIKDNRTPCVYLDDWENFCKSLIKVNKHHIHIKRPKITYFGLQVNSKGVKYSDIEKLPFFDFWLESAIGSSMPTVDGEPTVFFHDWGAFCELFIKTGKHRYTEDS